MMNDRELYATLLGVKEPWAVSGVVVDMKVGEVVVRVAALPDVRFACPVCGGAASRYDSRNRRWRHLDTMQFRTLLECDVPRVTCDEHGVHQVLVPWAEEKGRFTALFERLVIDLLKIASFKAVAERTGLSWDEVDGIQERAVTRGLLRKRAAPVRRLGVDETSFQRGHEYVTVVTNLDKGTVEYVGDDRTQAALDQYFDTLRPQDLDQVEVVSMDMWGPYIQSVTQWISDATRKIAFDKFHVAKHLGDAVDKVRRLENRELVAGGDNRLVGTKYWWLTSERSIRERLPTWLSEFWHLRESTLQVARAWAMKETAMALWRYTDRTWAKRAWTAWLSWAQRCRLKPMQRVAATIKTHLQGIINAMVLGVTNALAESINAKIQKLKQTACGYRNRGRFRAAIYFHLGGLNLYPRPSATHTIS